MAAPQAVAAAPVMVGSTRPRAQKGKWNCLGQLFWEHLSGFILESTMLLHTCQKSDPSNFMLREVFCSFTSKIISKIIYYTMSYLLFQEHFHQN